MIVEKGHEIGLHGYSHENPIAMTLEQQTAIMDKVGVQFPLDLNCAAEQID